MIDIIDTDKKCEHIYGWDRAWEMFITDKESIDKYADPLFPYCPLCGAKL